MSNVTKSMEIERPWSKGATEVMIYDVQRPDAKGNLAIELARHMCFVAGMPDGEDSAGRAKLRLMTTLEIADRACNLASDLWTEFQKRDWLLDLPEPKKLAPPDLPPTP